MVDVVIVTKLNHYHIEHHLLAAYRGTPLHTSSHSYRNPGWEAFYQMVNFTHLLRYGKQMAQKLLHTRISEKRTQYQCPGQSMGQMALRASLKDASIAFSVLQV